MGYESLATIVDGLVNGDVDNVAAHAGGDDQVAEPLLAEYLANVLGAVEYAVDCSCLAGEGYVGRGCVPFTDICLRYSSRVVSRIPLEMPIPAYFSNWITQASRMGRWKHTSIGYKNVNLPKFLDGVGDALLDRFRIGNCVWLARSSFSTQHTNHPLCMQRSWPHAA